MGLIECHAIFSLNSYKRVGKLIVDLKIFQISFKLDILVIMTWLVLIVTITFRVFVCRYLSSCCQDTSLYQPLNGAVQEYTTLSNCCQGSLPLKGAAQEYLTLSSCGQDTSLSTFEWCCTGVSSPKQLLPGYSPTLEGCCTGVSYPEQLLSGYHSISPWGCCTGVSYPEQLLPGYQSIRPWVVMYRSILPWAAAARISVYQPMVGTVQECLTLSSCCQDTSLLGHGW